jgi:hypothetical protein
MSDTIPRCVLTPSLGDMPCHDPPQSRTLARGSFFCLNFASAPVPDPFDGIPQGTASNDRDCHPAPTQEVTMLGIAVATIPLALIGIVLAIRADAKAEPDIAERDR